MTPTPEAAGAEMDQAVALAVIKPEWVAIINDKIRDADGDIAMHAYADTDLAAIQRLIAFCDRGLEHHRAKGKP